VNRASRAVGFAAAGTFSQVVQIRRLILFRVPTTTRAVDSFANITDALRTHINALSDSAIARKTMSAEKERPVEKSSTTRDEFENSEDVFESKIESED
jgi:hypothetical protein